MDQTKRYRGQENIKKKTKKANKYALVMFILFVILTLLLLYGYMFLTFKFYIVILLVPILFAIYHLLNFLKKKKKRKYIFSWIILILYSLIAVFGLYLKGTLNLLTDNSVTSSYYIVTKSTNTVNSIDELEVGETMGSLDFATQYGTINPQDDLEDSGYIFNFVESESTFSLVTSLYNDELSYILIPTLTDPQTLETYPNFSDETKVIYEQSETIKIENSGKDITSEPFTILIAGTDTRYDDIDSNSRTDAIMVVAVNPLTSKMEIVSLPRDAYIPSSCLGGVDDKLTHASLNGIDCLITDVENELDITIDYYAKVNFDAVIDAINAVGGIDVTVEDSFCGQDENDNLDAYCFSPGETHMSGEEALSYARERHSFADGDYARAEHQQQVIEGFIAAVATSSISEINDLLSVAEQSARTNLSSTDMVKFAASLISGQSYEINSYTVEGSGYTTDLPQWGLYSTSVQILDESSEQEAKDLINQVLLGEEEIPSAENSENSSE